MAVGFDLRDTPGDSGVLPDNIGVMGGLPPGLDTGWQRVDERTSRWDGLDPAGHQRIATLYAPVKVAGHWVAALDQAGPVGKDGWKTQRTEYFGRFQSLVPREHSGHPPATGGPEYEIRPPRTQTLEHHFTPGVVISPHYDVGQSAERIRDVTTLRVGHDWEVSFHPAPAGPDGDPAALWVREVGVEAELFVPMMHRYDIRRGESSAVYIPTQLDADYPPKDSGPATLWTDDGRLAVAYGGVTAYFGANGYALVKGSQTADITPSLDFEVAGRSVRGAANLRSALGAELPIE